LIFDADELGILRETASGDTLQYELARNLLAIERRYRTMGSRRGLFDELEKVITHGSYESAEEALARTKELVAAKTAEYSRGSDVELVQLGTTSVLAQGSAPMLFRD
jgi:hypothetical protein